jgi:hypothetical protein
VTDAERAAAVACLDMLKAKGVKSAAFSHNGQLLSVEFWPEPPPAGAATVMHEAGEDEAIASLRRLSDLVRNRHSGQAG